MVVMRTFTALTSRQIWDGRCAAPPIWIQRAFPLKQRCVLQGSNRALRVFRDRAGWYQSESESNIFEDKHQLDYVVGSGANGLTFLVRRGDYLFQAPLSYYSKPGKWDLSPGYENGDLGFSRSTPEGCVFCHSGRAQTAVDHPGAYLDPPFQELTPIGCENCHGPGGAHAHDPKRRGVIVNPAKLTPRLAENICMACHQRGDARVLQPGKTYQDFQPGQWLIETVAILKVPAQPMRSSASKISWTTMPPCKRADVFLRAAGKLSFAPRVTIRTSNRRPSTLLLIFG